jgi:hypothetical protein
MLQQCASAAAGINADIEIAGAPARPRGISVLQLTLFAPQREGGRYLQLAVAAALGAYQGMSAAGKS